MGARLRRCAEAEARRAECSTCSAFKIDAGYWELARSGTPQLSDDVLIKRAGDGQAKASAGAAVVLEPRRRPGPPLSLSRRRRRKPSGGRPQDRARRERNAARGPVRSAPSDGRFDAYGQKLDIERGILNFQGLIDNPGLNIRAIRSNLPVEAGVEVTGTARRPIVGWFPTPRCRMPRSSPGWFSGMPPINSGAGQVGALLAAAQSASRRPGWRDR
jgi:translocation and assembly module TamB